MKKKFAIIGAGISGLVFANFLKKNSEHEFILYERNSLLGLNEGYGIQLSVNGVSILNKIGFNDLKSINKFNPKKIDFYSLKNNSKICDLDISQFNSENTFYTTLKRSLLIQHLKEKLFSNSIQFNKKVLKINNSNSKIEIMFENNTLEIFDYLIISDGIFSHTKSILFEKNIKPKYFGSVAFRGLIKKKDLIFSNEKFISVFLGSNAHLVAYPINNKDEINLVAIIRKKLEQKDLHNKSFFDSKDNIMNLISQSSLNENINLKNIFNNVKDLKCFPIFVTDKIRKNYYENTFFLGDAFYGFPPAFAQGASQSIEAAYDLFNILKKENEVSSEKYFIEKVKKVKMIDQMSKLNYFVFHISNPVLVKIRNIVLRIIMNNKFFINKYLGKIYLRKP